MSTVYSYIGRPVCVCMEEQRKQNTGHVCENLDPRILGSFAGDLQCTVIVAVPCIYAAQIDLQWKPLGTERGIYYVCIIIIIA